MLEATVHIAQAAKNTLQPQTNITIAVDTAYVAAQQGRNVSKGIYMMDNRLATGRAGKEHWS